MLEGRITFEGFFICLENLGFLSIKGMSLGLKFVLGFSERKMAAIYRLSLRVDHVI